MRDIAIGRKGTFTMVVSEENLASKIEPSLPDVMSTPAVLAIMELAAMDAIRPFLDQGEGSVGVSAYLTHTAATPPGHRVRAEAEVVKTEGKQLEFNIVAYDENGEIGSGVHRRAIISMAKFNERLKAKIKK